MLIWLIICVVIFITYPNFETELKNKAMIAISFGILFGVNIISTLISSWIDNIKINKQIKDYIDMVNSYNSKLQISSSEEIEKLTKAYELILINADREYYTKKYNELVNNINMQEFHISQLEKHINIAKKLCERVGVVFDDIIIAKDTPYDEIIAETDITKDVNINKCYSLLYFLIKTNNYEIRLNGTDIEKNIGVQTYIKSVDIMEDEVYKF
jgi:hypothetical protein